MKILTEFLEQLTTAKDASYIRDVEMQDGLMTINTKSATYRFLCQIWDNELQQSQQVFVESDQFTRTGLNHVVRKRFPRCSVVWFRSA